MRSVLRVRPSWYSKYVPDASCVLYLPGQDDPQSSTIRDRSGNGNNGTIVGASWARQSKGIWALSFDGTDDYVNLSSPAFKSNQAGAIIMWANLDNVTTSNWVFSYCNLSTGYVDEFRLELVTVADAQTGYMRLIVRDNSVSTHLLRTAVGTLLRGSWEHIALTSDGSTTLMYINGVSKAITEGTGTADGVWFGDLTTDADAIYIGALARSNTYYSAYGKITLVRVHNEAPSATEIAGIYHNERHLFEV